MKATMTLPGLLVGTLLISACGPAIVTPPAVTTQTSMLATTQAVTPTVPSLPTTSATNVFCGGISFNLDPELGSGYSCETVAESSGAELPFWSIYPEYKEVTLNHYPLTDTTFNARIELIPVQRYQELLPELVNPRLADLQTLLAGGSVSGRDLPLLPIFDQQQAFSSKVAVLSFTNGHGVRYLTQYGQGPTPINNQELIYTFQGLTSDGKYWVSAILPVNSPDLMADGKNPPNGQSWEDFTNGYLTYIANTSAQLEAQSPDSFTPSLTVLDDLIRSITIQP